MQRLDLLLLGRSDVHLRLQHLWTHELLDRLHRSQRVQRQLCRLLQRQLRVRFELHAHRRSERQRLMHRKLDVQHQLHGIMFSELFVGLDVRAQMRDG